MCCMLGKWLRGVVRMTQCETKAEEMKLYMTQLRSLKKMKASKKVLTKVSMDRKRMEIIWSS
jgi:hypothetical protein